MIDLRYLMQISDNLGGAIPISIVQEIHPGISWKEYAVDDMIPTQKILEVSRTYDDRLPKKLSQLIKSVQVNLEISVPYTCKQKFL